MVTIMYDGGIAHHSHFFFIYTFLLLYYYILDIIKELLHRTFKVYIINTGIIFIINSD